MRCQKREAAASVLSRTVVSRSSGNQATALFVLGLLVCEALPSPIMHVSIVLSPSERTIADPNARAMYVRNIFPELSTNHLLCDENILVLLAVVNGEAQADKVRQDGSGSLLGADRRRVEGRRESAREGKSIREDVNGLVLERLFQVVVKE